MSIWNLKLKMSKTCRDLRAFYWGKFSWTEMICVEKLTLCNSANFTMFQFFETVGLVKLGPNFFYPKLTRCVHLLLKLCEFVFGQVIMCCLCRGGIFAYCRIPPPWTYGLVFLYFVFLCCVFLYFCHGRIFAYCWIPPPP